MTDSTANSWIRIARPNAHACRLFCFSWAGGGSSAFSRWGDLLPDVEVCGVQLPGREDRLRERPRTSVLEVVEELAALPDFSSSRRPFALFGHSLGALVAFELARTLRRRGGAQPVRLFASACEAPDATGGGNRHRLPDAELVEEMQALNGTSSAVFRETELMALLLPLMRADFTMAETYRYTPEAPLDVPITAFAGTHDPEVTFESVEGWRRQTSKAFAIHTIPGGHFFVQSARDEVLRLVRDDLRFRAETLV